MSKKAVIEGSMAVAEAVKACRPKVISAYPISPQTHIVEDLAKMIADKELDSTMVRVDSEFSAASVICGASATGVRAYTASSSQGLLLMTEVLFNTAGMRLPIVITGVNRTISAPITIQPDHQDTMTLRDAGLIQLYVENSQEAYATHIQAFKIAEDREILLPVMVCMDGWILTHSFEPVEIYDQELVDKFLPEYDPLYCLDPEKPITYGSYADNEVMEFRYMMQEAMERAKDKIQDVALEYKELFGEYYGGLIEEYRTEGADVIVVAMGSVLGTIKDAVDEMRENGQKVGAIKVRSYRPFPAEELYNAVKDASIIAVLDKSLSIGQGGPLATDTKAAFYNKKAPKVASFMAGLGGREVTKETIKNIVYKCKKALELNIVADMEFVDLRREII
ncbi:MAG TPA: pyruvate ferredoxin oxidoreductase [Thermoanaerobacterales bacterium]|nr:pyruvate ferredoxin oxidoreductase [Thermoanaerobacterales bacterium]